MGLRLLMIVSALMQEAYLLNQHMNISWQTIIYGLQRMTRTSTMLGAIVQTVLGQEYKADQMQTFGSRKSSIEVQYENETDLGSLLVH
jgi:hypothetical protein